MFIVVVLLTLTNKTVLITGCSSGIGRALTKSLLNSGAKVCGVSREVSKVEEFIYNDNFHHFPFDLLDLNGIKDLSKRIIEQAGAINGLVHSAGVEITVPIHLIKYDKYLNLFKLNSFAAFELIKAFSKKSYFMPDETSFVLISSLATQIGAQGKAIYAASKGALEGYLKPASKELIKKGIRLNLISPGILKTPMNETFFEKLSVEQIHKLNDGYPLGIGEVEYAVNTISFLLSNESKWITAQNITIDGGNLIT